MMDKRLTITKYKLSLPMIILSGILFVILALKMDSQAGPDENMRMLVVNWIAEHNTLPTGFETELINPLWGFSYAFTPYLPSMIAAIFVKIASVFTSDPQVLLFAARMVGVLSGMGIMLVAFRIGDKLFDNKGSVYFFVSTAAYLPQFTFLSSYLNNDIVSVLSAFMILDAVLDGKKDNWSVKNMVYLAFGVGLCALTYYFGYAWILFAIVGFFVTSFRQEKDKKTLFRKAGIIALLVFVIAGWYFIRNGIIYEGDFLGYEAQSRCVEMFKERELIWPVNNPGMNTMHLRDMLTYGRWIETTEESFIGMFGGMTICLDGKFYDLYKLAFWMCILLFALFRYKTKEKIRTSFILMLLFTIAFPIVFSIYSSYTRDFQPQGRYIMTILPALCVFTSVGIDEFSKAVNEKYKDSKPVLGMFGKASPAIACVCLFVLFIMLYYTVMLPTLTFICLPGSTSVMFYYVR